MNTPRPFFMFPTNIWHYYTKPLLLLLDIIMLPANRLCAALSALFSHLCDGLLARIASLPFRLGNLDSPNYQSSTVDLAYIW